MSWYSYDMDGVIGDGVEVLRIGTYTPKQNELVCGPKSSNNS